MYVSVHFAHKYMYTYYERDTGRTSVAQQEEENEKWAIQYFINVSCIELKICIFLFLTQYKREK